MQNPYNIWGTPADCRGSEAPPSIYGALPYSTSRRMLPLLAFTFTSLNPSVLNCVVLGPNNHPQFQITTNTSMPGYTILRGKEGKNIGLIEWRPDGSQVEVLHVVRKQPAGSFLRLSGDHKYRIMQVQNTDYLWIIEGSAISMYLAGEVKSPTLLARLKRQQNGFKLEVANDVVQGGLLHPVLIAAVLLQSGQSF
ncbi:hypothetical protein BDZ89DRAFT_945854 [Hymenopellis radicata]|nr:hypothetical protein BDZ89DRAFT_945854 [Hymenopellis radicata]